MLIIYLIILVPYANLNAIIIEGVDFTSPSQTAVKMFADKHPDTSDQVSIKEQLAIIEAYTQSQHKHKPVILTEEPSQHLIERWKSRGVVETLSGMRGIAERHNIAYDNIDLRSSFLAAAYVFERHLRDTPFDAGLAFGPSQKQLKQTHNVTLNDLFEEKERYIYDIKKIGTWSDREQKQVDSMHHALLNKINGYDLQTSASEFCVHTSKKIVNEVNRASNILDCYLFDSYARQKIMHYSQDHTVIFVAGSRHIDNIKEDLKAHHNWTDYSIYYKGGTLPSHELKSMLGLVTWQDSLRNSLCCCN